MSLLDRDAYRAVFDPPMLRLPEHATPPFDFWPYFDTISEEDFAGYDCSAGQVKYAWQSQDGRFVHVLVSSAQSKNVFMVIILDLTQSEIYGHHLLNLEL